MPRALFERVRRSRSNFSAQAVENRFGVVAHALLENDLRILNGSNVFGEVAIEQDQVSLLPCSNRTDLVGAAQESGAILRSDVNRLNGSEACFNEQFNLALVAEAGQCVAVAGGIAAGHERRRLQRIRVQISFPWSGVF